MQENDKYSKDLFGPHGFYSVHFVLLNPLWFYLVHFDPIWSTLVLFCPLQSYSSHSVHFGHIRSILHTLVFQSTLVLFGPLCLLQSYSIDIGFIWSTLALFGPILSNLVIFDPIRSYTIHYVHFGLNLSIHSYPLYFSLNRSNLVHLIPIWSTLFHLV